MSWKPDWENSPEVKRLLRRSHRNAILTNWMVRIPIAGRVMSTFWFGLLDEGVKQTCTPRWGALTFHFLNDGMKPTLWHTWYEMTHDNFSPYSGIYPSGAPRNAAEAEGLAFPKEVNP
jgi:hypothetical protein